MPVLWGGGGRREEKTIITHFILLSTYSFVTSLTVCQINNFKNPDLSVGM